MHAGRVDNAGCINVFTLDNEGRPTGAQVQFQFVRIDAHYDAPVIARMEASQHGFAALEHHMPKLRERLREVGARITKEKFTELLLDLGFQDLSNDDRESAAYEGLRKHKVVPSAFRTSCEPDGQLAYRKVDENGRDAFAVSRVGSNRKTKPATNVWINCQRAPLPRGASFDTFYIVAFSSAWASLFDHSAAQLRSALAVAANRSDLDAKAVDALLRQAGLRRRKA